MDDILNKVAKIVGSPFKAPKKNPIDLERDAIERGASELGIDPIDYATAISYETGGTFSPTQPGPKTKWGQHRGTIQYGEPQWKEYGVKPDFQDQVTRSNVEYLRKAGVKPGATFEQIYAAINGGSANKSLSTPDWNTGRTIADNIRNAQRDHRAKVLQRYGWTDEKIEDVLGKVDSILGGGQSDDVLDKVNQILSPTFPNESPKIPVPEQPETLDAQVRSVLDGNSPKSAVLFTGDQEKLADPSVLRSLQRIQRPEGVLYVNPTKAPDFDKRTTAELIGKVDDVKDTSKGSTLVTTDAQGRELSSSIVNSPESAAKQAQIDRASFPQAARSDVGSVDDALNIRTLGGYQEEVPPLTDAQYLKPNLAGEQGAPQIAPQRPQAQPVPKTRSQAVKTPRKGITEQEVPQKEITTQIDWLPGSTRDTALDQAAAQLGQQIGVDAKLVREKLKGFAEGDFSPERADRLKKAKQPVTFALEEGVVQELQDQDKYNKESQAARQKLYDAELLNSANQDQNPKITQLNTLIRAGMIDEAKGRELIEQERQAQERFEAARHKPGEAYLDPVTGQISATAERVQEREKELGRTPFSQEEIQNIISKYGGFAEKEQRERDIEKKYANRPLARPSEAVLNIARYIAKTPATALHTLGMGMDAQTGIKDNPYNQIADAWVKRIDSSANPDFEGEYMADLIPKGLAQLGVQAVLTATTGIGGVLLPLAEGATSQYNEARKAGASKEVRLLSGSVGALAAVPGTVLHLKYFKNLLPAQQKAFVDKLTKETFGRFSKFLPEPQARQATQSFVGQFAKKAGFGAVLEPTQEQSENIINNTVKKLTYDPKITWKDVFVPSEDEQKGLVVASILGGVGGSMEFASRMSDADIAKAPTEIEKALAEGLTTPEEAKQISAAVAKEAKKRNITLKPIVTETPQESPESVGNVTPESQSEVKAVAPKQEPKPSRPKRPADTIGFDDYFGKEPPTADLPKKAEKEPWQQTRETAVWQGYAPDGANTDRALKGRLARWEKIRKNAAKENVSIEAVEKAIAQEKARIKRANDHRAAVEQALKEGKPVPAKVLADYPDLQPQKTGKSNQSDWREAVDSIPDEVVGDDHNDQMHKNDILRAVTKVSKSPQELSDILDRAEKLNPYLVTNLAWDVAHNPAATPEIKARAMALYERIYPPTSEEDQRETDTKRLEQQLERAQEQQQNLEGAKGKGVKQERINNQRYIDSLNKELQSLREPATPKEVEPQKMAQERVPDLQSNEATYWNAENPVEAAKGQLQYARKHKVAAFKKVKTLREQIKNANVRNKPSLRVELIKAEGTYKEHLRNEQSIAADIKRLNERVPESNKSIADDWKGKTPVEIADAIVAEQGSLENAIKRVTQGIANNAKNRREGAGGANFTTSLVSALNSDTRLQTLRQVRKELIARRKQLNEKTPPAVPQRPAPVQKSEMVSPKVDKGVDEKVKSEVDFMRERVGEKWYVAARPLKQYEGTGAIHLTPKKYKALEQEWNESPEGIAYREHIKSVQAEMRKKSKQSPEALKKASSRRATIAPDQTDKSVPLEKSGDEALKKVSDDFSLDTLRKENGELDYDRIKTIAAEIVSGESQIIRLNDEEERGRILGGRRNVEASIIAGTSEGADKEGKPDRGAVRRSEEVLEKYAREEGIWFDFQTDLKNKLPYIAQGFEASVFRDADPAYVLKAIHFPATSPLEALDNRISVFNYLFPETFYELVGFTRNEEDGFAFVVRQPLIIGEVGSEDVKGLTARMREAGLLATTDPEKFTSSDYLVKDLHSLNYIKSGDRIFVIDAITQLNSPDVGGKRDYRPFTITSLEALKKDADYREEFKAAKGKTSEEIFEKISSKDITDKGEGVAEITAEAHEIIRRALEHTNRKPETAFDGIFLQPAKFNEVKKSIFRLIKDTEKISPKHAENIREFYNAFVANTDRDTKVLYVFDSALPHESRHKGRWVNAVGENLEKRHSKFKELTELKGESGRSLLDVAYDNFYFPKGYDRNNAILIEEAATMASTGEYEKLGWTSDEAAEFLLLDAESRLERAKQNPDFDFGKFLENERGIDTAYDSILEKVSDIYGQKESKKEPGADAEAGQLETPKSEKTGTDQKDDRKRSLPQTLREAGLEADDELYDIYGDKEAVSSANDILEKRGVDSVIQQLEDATGYDKTKAVLSVMVQRILLNETAKTGDNKYRQKALELASKHAQLATEAGQFIQAAAMTTQSADGVIFHAQKIALKRKKPLTPDEYSQVETVAVQAEDALNEWETLKAEIRKLKRQVSSLKKRRTVPVNNAAIIARAKTQLPSTKDLIASIRKSYEEAALKMVELSDSEHFRKPLQHLLGKPNDGLTGMILGEEKEMFRKDGAFTYSTRHTSRPNKTFPVDVVGYESPAGKRFLAMDGDLVVAAAFIDTHNKLIGIITEGGFERVGIGTNLAKAVFEFDSTIEADGVASKQGQRLLARLGKLDSDDALKSVSPDTPPIVKYGAAILLDKKLNEISRGDFAKEIRAIVGDKLNETMPMIFAESFNLRQDLISNARKEIEFQRVQAETGKSDDEVKAEIKKREQERAESRAKGSLAKKLANLYAPGVVKDKQDLIAIAREMAEDDEVADYVEKIVTKEITEAPRDKRKLHLAAKKLLEQAKIEHQVQKDAIKANIVGGEQEQARLEREEFFRRKALKEKTQNIARMFRKLEQHPARFYTTEAWKVAGEARSVLASADLSAALRQGFYFTVTNPVLTMGGNKDLSSAFLGMVRSVKKEKHADIVKQIEKHPNFHRMLQMGIEFAEAGSNVSSLTQAEENIRTEYAKKIPGLKTMLEMSERTYGTFLDLQRALIADSVIKEFESQGITIKNNKEEYEAMGRLINIATGRGGFKRADWNNAMSVLGRPLFAPRYAASRFQLLGHVAGGMATMPPAARKIAVKRAARFHTVVSLPLLSAAALGLIALDPDDDDFLKIRVGEKARYETTGGLQSYVRYIARMGKAVANKVSTGKGDLSSDLMFINKSFWGNKLAPVPAYLYAAAKGKEPDRTDFHWGYGALKRMTPIFLQEVSGAAYEDGALGALAVAPAFLGIGVGYYPDKTADHKAYMESSEFKRVTTDELVDVILEERAKGKDTKELEKALLKKAANARKRKSLTKEEQANIDKVIGKSN